MMLPFSLAFITTWTIFLLVFWAAGLPLGIQGAYTYPETNGPGGDRCSTSPR